MTALVVALSALLALALIWFGYPVAVRLLAALRPRSSAAASGATGVSVILASCNDAESIRARVANLLDTDHPATLLEVVVALDAANAEATPSELEGLDEGVRVVAGDVPGGK